MGQAQRRGVMSVALVVIGLIIGVLFGFFVDGNDEEDSPSTATPPHVSGPGPMDELNGVPVGYVRTEEGAVAAATNFNLLSGRDDLLDPNALRRAMQTFATPSWKKEAAKQAKSGYDYVAETYGADADVSTAMLAYDVTNFSPDHAVVNLWTVTTLSGSARPNVEEVWGIVTVELNWMNNDWRVSGIESTPGPAPVDLPSRSPEVPARVLMEEFDEFERAPVP